MCAGYTPLWTAAIHGFVTPGHEATLKLLLKAKADPNVKDKEGCNTLFPAIIIGGDNHMVFFFIRMSSEECCIPRYIEL